LDVLIYNLFNKQSKYINRISNIIHLDNNLLNNSYYNLKKISKYALLSNNLLDYKIENYNGNYFVKKSLNGSDTESLTIRVEDNNRCGNYSCTSDHDGACTVNCNQNNNPWYYPSNWFGGNTNPAPVVVPTTVPAPVIYYQTPVVNQVASSQTSGTTASAIKSTSNSSSKNLYDVSKNSQIITGTPVSADSDQNNLNGNNLSANAGYSIGSFFPNTLIGWLVLFIFVLLIVFISRRYDRESNRN
jgi:hypothetical protein